MRQELKEEAETQAILDIRSGFYDQEAIFDRITEMFYDEEDFDETWLQQTIAEQFLRHETESASWPKPSDFNRLAHVFDLLIRQKIVCLHNAGYTIQDAVSECTDTIEQLGDAGVTASSYAYYHAQDVERVIDSGDLYIGFGSTINDDAAVVGRKVAEVLRQNQFETEWDGTAGTRILVKNMVWHKLYDGTGWGAGRVIQMLTPEQKSKGLGLWKWIRGLVD